MRNRRDFLKGVAVAGAASGIGTSASAGAEGSESQPALVSALPPSSQVQAMEGEGDEFYTEVEAAHYFVQKPCSDFMVDVIKKLGIEYVASNPGSSFRGLQESIVTYGGNSRPEFLTCLHEETSVAMGHGYAKIAGKPLGVACHGTVGLQHAAMAVYNAYCDQVPVIIFAGNHLEATERRPGAEWAHSAQDAAKLVRDFIKWDDMPLSLQHFAESAVRAYKLAMTPPMGPVVIIVDGHLQEQDMGDAAPEIPDLDPTIPPQGDGGALREAARLLVEAESPVIVVDRYARTSEGMKRLVELAESLQAPVVDRGSRMNLPNDHYLNQSGRGSRLIREADVILGLEMADFWSTVNRLHDLVHREQERIARDDVKLISLGVNDLFLKSNYQNFQRYQPVDLSIAGDAEATLPALIEEVRRALPNGRRAQLEKRAEDFRIAHAKIREEWRKEATLAWNARPVSTARVSIEVWRQIADRDWSLVGRDRTGWAERLWTMNRHYHYNLSASGGVGVGYGAPAAAGGALANRQHGRFSVNIQSDGDLMYAPGVLWTAAHHNIPLLTVMHNNRGYHTEVMHLQRMASRRQRGLDDRVKVGNVFEEPFIEYAGLAKSLGVWAEGPISDPADVAPALKRAIQVVERGEPALVDVVCQPR